MPSKSKAGGVSAIGILQWKAARDHWRGQAATQRTVTILAREGAADADEIRRIGRTYWQITPGVGRTVLADLDRLVGNDWTWPRPD